VTSIRLQRVSVKFIQFLPIKLLLDFPKSEKPKVRFGQNKSKNVLIDRKNYNKKRSISLYHTLLRMRSQIEKSIEELARKIDVATHSKQSVINGYGQPKILATWWSNSRFHCFFTLAPSKFGPPSSIFNELSLFFCKNFLKPKFSKFTVEVVHQACNYESFLFPFLA
jgi:hypothetical protein